MNLTQPDAGGCRIEFNTFFSSVSHKEGTMSQDSFFFAFLVRFAGVWASSGTSPVFLWLRRLARCPL